MPLHDTLKCAIVQIFTIIINSKDMSRLSRIFSRISIEHEMTSNRAALSKQQSADSLFLKEHNEKTRSASSNVYLSEYLSMSGPSDETSNRWNILRKFASAKKILSSAHMKNVTQPEFFFSYILSSSFSRARSFPFLAYLSR